MCAVADARTPLQHHCDAEIPHIRPSHHHPSFSLFGMFKVQRCASKHSTYDSIQGAVSLREVQQQPSLRQPSSDAETALSDDTARIPRTAHSEIRRWRARIPRTAQHAVHRIAHYDGRAAQHNDLDVIYCAVSELMRRFPSASGRLRSADHMWQARERVGAAAVSGRLSILHAF